MVSFDFTYITTLLTIGSIYAIAASSLNIITGYAGLVSIGHAAFLAVGAYAEALLILRYGLPFLLALPIAVLLGAILGVMLGLPALRVSDDFLAVATIGVNFIVVAILKYSSFFGGTLGLGPISRPEIFGYSLTAFDFFLLTAVMLGLTVITSWWLRRSWSGLALAAMKEDPVAAEAVGISTARFKIIAFMISGAFAGLSGALFVHYFNFITPENFGFLLSVDILIFAVFGGLGTTIGPVAGAYVLYLVPQAFRVFAEYRIVLYGTVLIFIMVFEPGGLIGLYRRYIESSDTKTGEPSELRDGEQE